MTPTISVIIPVFGSERFIAQCLASLRSQTFKDYEAIIVNDGTKDRSIEIAKDTIRHDARFKIFHKENGGQSSARNFGLNKARGKYIAFVDSDDFVEADFLLLMYKKIVETGAEICLCNVRLLNEDGESIGIVQNRTEDYLAAQDFLNTNHLISDYMCDKLFQRKVFDGMRFDTRLRSGEDVHLLFRLLYGRRLTQVTDILYNYIQHSQSTSHIFKNTYVNDRLILIEAQMSFAKEKQISNKTYVLDAYLKNFVYNCIMAYFFHSKNFLSDIKLVTAKIDTTKLNFKNIFRLAFRDKTQAFVLFLFHLSPHLFYFVYPCLRRLKRFLHPTKQ